MASTSSILANTNRTDNGVRKISDISEGLFLNFTTHHHHLDPSESERSTLPLWSVIAFFTLVNLVGVVLNLICIVYAHKKKRRGIYALILQIALSDLITLTVVSVLEIWSHYNGSWTFGLAVCRLYSSAEIFTETSNIYLLVVMSLHALAHVNIKKKFPGSSKDSEELLEEVTEMKSSQHNLVSRTSTLSSNEQNDVVIQTKRPTIPVTIPSVLTWFLSLSLSMPMTILTKILSIKTDLTICTLLEGPHLIFMRLMLTIFHILIPFAILSTTTALMIYKVCKLPQNARESLFFLKTSLFLCALFFIFSVPRFALASFHGIMIGNKEAISSPLVNYNITPVSVPVVLSLLHYFTPVIKPLGYLYFFKTCTKNFLFEKERHRNSSME